MFYDNSFLHAVVDVDGLGSRANSNNTTTAAVSSAEGVIKGRNLSDNKTSGDHDVSSSEAVIDDNTLSNRQRQKLKRKLKKQKAIEQKRRLTTDVSQSLPSYRRLHHFISTVFRSELNIAENGVGHFIRNAASVSAHHAILKGVVRVNGKVTKVGSTILQFGDCVSLEIDANSQSELVSWKGSKEVAKTLELHRDYGERKGRMSTIPASSICVTNVDSNILATLPCIKYYRLKLSHLWIPSIHEVAMMTPLPLTVRVLKNSHNLEQELRGFGFQPLQNSDISFQLSNETYSSSDDTQQHQFRSLDPIIIEEFMSKTWINKGNNNHSRLSRQESERKLGIFLSEARISGEVLQQELNSMLPVSILMSILKTKMKEDKAAPRPIHILDLCAAPGSKTCNLISALESTLIDRDGGAEQKLHHDFVVVANELNPSRATQLQQRCFQQCGSNALPHLIITNTDGRDFKCIEKHSFDYIICDVPCSGDGTIRRSPDLLYKWTTNGAEKNKPIQRRLLAVSLELLRPGGVCVYSTCSMNPKENDEVLNETLNELNSNHEEYSLVDLENICEGGTGGYLRILPAAHHGGFFVAAIRRKESTLKELSNGLDNVAYKVELMWKTTEATAAKLAYAISPCTRRLSKYISERLNCVVKGGVPIMYKSKEGNFLLQEGCSAMAMTGIYHGLASYVQLSLSQLRKYATQSDCRTLSIPKKLLTYINEETTTLIVHVDSLYTLPAKIALQKQNLDRFDNQDDDDVTYEVEITARPQILKRTISGESSI